MCISKAISRTNETFQIAAGIKRQLDSHPSDPFILASEIRNQKIHTKYQFCSGTPLEPYFSFSVGLFSTLYKKHWYHDLDDSRHGETGFSRWVSRKSKMPSEGSLSRVPNTSTERLAKHFVRFGVDFALRRVSLNDFSLTTPPRALCGILWITVTVLRLPTQPHLEHHSPRRPMPKLTYHPQPLSTQPTANRHTNPKHVNEL